MNWIDNLVRAGILQNDRKPAVHVLMGGNIQDDWQLFPERAAIVIGTQDQLLSRALNRGYSMSRFMWPVHFALLNTDCLWVLDEVQLMGSGIATSAQLQAFRKDLGTIFDTKSIWMSATHSGSWLRTVDFQKHSQNLFELGLSDNDKAHPEIKRRFFAGKPISRIDAPHGDLKAICGKVLSLHRRGSLTLVIVNRVQRAVELYRILSKKADADLVLIHSRFRPVDRRKALDRLLSRSEKDDMICVSTCNVAH